MCKNRLKMIVTELRLENDQWGSKHATKTMLRNYNESVKREKSWLQKKIENSNRDACNFRLSQFTTSFLRWFLVALFLTLLAYVWACRPSSITEKKTASVQRFQELCAAFIWYIWWNLMEIVSLHWVNVTHRKVE